MNWFKDYVSSSDFGRDFAKDRSHTDIEIDGHIELNTTFDGHEEYRIFNVDKELIAQGILNFSGSKAVYVVYEIAKKHGIYKPSNLLLDTGQFSSAGIAQPNFTSSQIQEFVNDPRIQPYLR